MTDFQEQVDLILMEQALHEHVLGPWSKDHANRPGSVIKQVEYNRDLYPEQRLDVSTTPADVLPTYLLPGRLLSVIIERKLANEVKSPRVASRMIDSFRRQPVSKDDNTPLVKRVLELTKQGETISMVDAHADFRGGLRMLAAFTAATRKSGSLRRNKALISKTMSREEFDGKRVSKLVTPVARVVWVIPDTDSFDEIKMQQVLDDKTADLIDRAGEKVNLSAMRVLAREKGGVLQWAPFSSAVKPIYSDRNELTKLKMPNLPSQAPGLHWRSRYSLPVATWSNPKTGEVSWSIGQLLERDKIDARLDKKVREGLYLELAIGEMCTMLANLSKKPVEHLGKIFEPA